MNFQIDAKELTYELVDGCEVAAVDVEIVAKTPDYREVARSRHTMHNLVDGRGSRTRDVLDQSVLELEPGDYRLALCVRDTRSGNVGIFTSEMTVRYLTADLAISDIQLASDVQRDVPDHRFSRGEYVVVPNPTGLVRRGSTAFLYFEIYGLDLSSTGAALYSIKLTIREPAPRGRGRFRTSRGEVLTGVSAEYLGRGRARVAQEYVALDVSTMEVGTYQIEIKVLDHVSDRSTSPRVAIQVVED